MTAPVARFTHEAVFYDDLAGFLDDTVPFLQAGIDASEPALVVVEPDKATAMRSALHDVEHTVRFADMSELGRNPGRLISAWAEFLGEYSATQPVRGIGEPVWRGKSRDEIAECQRNEALVNVAFADRHDFVLMCPYDRAHLDESILAEARTNHPLLVRDGETVQSAAFDGIFEPFVGSLTEPTGDVERWTIEEHSLADLRRWVSDLATAAGLDPDHTEDLALAVTEAATNSLQHAGGRGVLRVWLQDSRVVCEVRDRGRIEDPLAGRLPVTFEAPSGRGLWLVNQLCDLVQIRSSDSGNVVRMHMGDV